MKSMKIKNLLTMIRNRRDREILYSTPNYWDSKAVEYKGNSISMWPNNHLNKLYHTELALMVSKILPSVEGTDILDVGCGAGRISYHLADQGAKVTGIDFSAKAIESAQKRAQCDNPTFRVQSIFDLTDSALFDMVISWGSVTLACKNREELLNVMRRLRKALRPDGKMLLLEPIHKGILHRVLNMDIREFCKVVTEAKFKVKEIRHMHFWPCRLLLAYIPWPNFITAPIYYFGQGIMRLMNNQAFGDYIAVYSVIDRSVEKGNEKK